MADPPETIRSLWIRCGLLLALRPAGSTVTSMVMTSSACLDKMFSLLTTELSRIGDKTPIKCGLDVLCASGTYRTHFHQRFASARVDAVSTHQSDLRSR